MNKEKIINMAEELAEFVMELARREGIQPYDMLEVVGTSLVSLTATTAKDGYVNHALLTMVAAVAIDARTLMMAAAEEEEAEAKAKAGEAAE
jgi:hypothetical protein